MKLHAREWSNNSIYWHLISKSGKTSYRDVMFIGTVMVAVQHILDKDQSAFPNDIFPFPYVRALHSRSSCCSHEDSQTSITSGKCSLFWIHSNYCLYHFFGINYVQAVSKLWQACNWKVSLYFHCLELGINGGWVSSWPTEASWTYNVLLVPSLFRIVFKENVSWLPNWTWRSWEEISPLQTQASRRSICLGIFSSLLPDSLGDIVTLRLTRRASLGITKAKRNVKNANLLWLFL